MAGRCALKVGVGASVVLLSGVGASVVLLSGVGAAVVLLTSSADVIVIEHQSCGVATTREAGDNVCVVDDSERLSPVKDFVEVRRELRVAHARSTEGVHLHLAQPRQLAVDDLLCALGQLLP